MKNLLTVKKSKFVDWYFNKNKKFSELTKLIKQNINFVQQSVLDIEILFNLCKTVPAEIVENYLGKNKTIPIEECILID